MGGRRGRGGRRRKGERTRPTPSRPLIHISGYTPENRAILTTAEQLEVIYGPSKGAILDDLERRSTPNPDFKVTPLFDAECLRNGTRDNGMLIWTYTRPTHRCLFE